MRNVKSTLDQTIKKLSRAQIIERLVTKNLKGGGDDVLCPPPRMACPPPRIDQPDEL